MSSVGLSSSRWVVALRVELTGQSSTHTVDTGAVQKGADFVKAFALGFDVNVSRSNPCGLTLGRYCSSPSRRLVH